jgi:phospholipase C
LPYELHVHGEVNASQGTIQLRFRNSGEVGTFFHVRFGDGQTEPRAYTVGAGDETSDTFAVSSVSSYDLSVFGPNGFLRTFAGSLATGSANLTVETICDKRSEGIALEIHNHSADAETVKVVDAYSGKTITHLLHAHSNFTYFSQLQESFGWYDLAVQVESDASFQRRLAGHVETGRDSMTDPAIGAALPQVAVGT